MWSSSIFKTIYISIYILESNYRFTDPGSFPSLMWQLPQTSRSSAHVQETKWHHPNIIFQNFPLSQSFAISLFAIFFRPNQNLLDFSFANQACHYGYPFSPRTEYIPDYFRSLRIVTPWSDSQSLYLLDFLRLNVFSLNIRCTEYSYYTRSIESRVQFSTSYSLVVSPSTFPRTCPEHEKFHLTNLLI